jgi:hypothetical protein
MGFLTIVDISACIFTLRVSQQLSVTSRKASRSYRRLQLQPNPRPAVLAQTWHRLGSEVILSTVLHVVMLASFSTVSHNRVEALTHDSCLPSSEDTFRNGQIEGLNRGVSCPPGSRLSGTGPYPTAKTKPGRSACLQEIVTLYAGQLASCGGTDEVVTVQLCMISRRSVKQTRISLWPNTHCISQ